jgi:hypothetical protein
MCSARFAILASLLPAVVSAQSHQGGIRGQVTDSAQAAVARVKVTIVDQAANVPRSTVSNDAGEYVFSAVNPATYSLSAEVPGFKKFERKNILVGTQEFLTVDIRLEAGQVNESIVVEEVPLIETTNASQGQVIDRREAGRSAQLRAQPLHDGHDRSRRHPGR